MLVAARPRGPHAELKPALQHLNAVYEAFAAVRKQRGAIDFDLPEAKIELDERGQVRSVRAVERLVTHKIIEECMIAANVEAAKRIHKGKIPGLVPRSRRARTKASSKSSCCSCARSATSSRRSKISPKEINRILASVSGKPEEELVETVVLRSMMQARYQPGNVGHFGLALGAYAHFTSPIRRYPDLLVHRAIKWLNDKRSAKGFRYALAGDGAARRALFAHRASRRRSDARGGRAAEVHLSEGARRRNVRRGHQQRRRVRACSCALPEVQADGLVHVTALPRDYYHRDPTGTTLKGERSGREYRLTEIDQGASRRRQRRGTQDRLRSRRERDERRRAEPRRGATRPWLAARNTSTGCTRCAPCSSDGRKRCSRRRCSARRAASSPSSCARSRRAA